MLIVKHRINSIQTLKQIPEIHGIEIDVRDSHGKICLAHDPYDHGERLENFLKFYRHAFLIVNTKSDGLEMDVLRMLKRRSVQKFFFLDVAPPTLIRLVRQGISQIAVRFSEYEPIESCFALSGKVDWVWVDCFNFLPLNAKNYKRLKRHFKICLVSPELQTHPVSWIRQFKCSCAHFEIDAVCTDFPNLWMRE